MNKKGQEGAGFRLIIEAVLVVFILVIILGVITQIDEWRWKVSEKRLFEGFDKSLNSPDGSIIVEKELVLKNGASYTSRAFANSVVGVDTGCIELDAVDSSAFTLSNKKLVEVNTVIQANMFYQCLPGYAVGEDQCDVYCIVSFGKELTKEE